MKFMQMSQRQGAWNKSLSQAAPPEQTSAWKKKPSQPFVPASSSTPSSSSTQTTQANAAVYAAGSLPLNSPALRLWVQQQVANFKPDFAGLIDLFVTNPDDAEVQSIAEGVLGTSPRLSIFLKHLFLYRGPASNSGSSGKNADAGDKSKIASPSKPAGGSGGPTPAASELSLRTLQRQPSTDILNSSASPIEVPSLSGVGGPKKLSPEETSMAAVSAAGAFPSLDVKVSKNTENIHLAVNRNFGVVKQGKPSKKKAAAVAAAADARQLAHGTRERPRHMCKCLAQEHDFFSNCTACGRIVCSQEGEGNCFFCGSYVTKTFTSVSSDFYKEISTVVMGKGALKASKASTSTSTPSASSSTSTSSSAAPELKVQGVASNNPDGGVDGEDEEEEEAGEYEDAAVAPPSAPVEDEKTAAGRLAAEQHRDKLLARAKASQGKPKVIDEQGDFYEFESNRWMDDKEREQHRKRAEAIEEFIATKQRERILNIDATTGTVSMTRRTDLDGLFGAASISGAQRAKLIEEFEREEEKKKKEIERINRARGLLQATEAETIDVYGDSLSGEGPELPLLPPTSGSTYANSTLKGRAREVYDLLRQSMNKVVEDRKKAASGGNGPAGGQQQAGEKKMSKKEKKQAKMAEKALQAAGGELHAAIHFGENMHEVVEGKMGPAQPLLSAIAGMTSTLSGLNRPSQASRIQHESYDDVSGLDAFASSIGLDAGDGRSNPLVCRPTMEMKDGEVGGPASADAPGEFVG